MTMKPSSEPTLPILIQTATDSVTVTEPAMELVSLVQIPHRLTQHYQSTPTVMPIQITTQTVKAASSQILTMITMDSLMPVNWNAKATH